MSKSSLKQKALSGVIWSFIDRVFNQGLQFVIAVALARLLTPSDYGLVGMLTIFIFVANACVDGGFSQAIIQKKNRTEEDYSTVFYINFLIAIALYACLYFLAPHIACFYDTKELIDTSRVLFLTIIINALYIVPDAKLTIEMNFKAKAKLNLLALVGSGLVALYFANIGAGVWALVYQSLSRSFFYLLFITWCHSWKPQLQFSSKSCSRLFSFGSKLLLTGILSIITQNLYQMMIGRFFSPQTVGYYTQGKKYTIILSNTVTDVLQRVTYPLMTSVQDDKERLLGIYRRVFKMTSFIIIPSMTGLALIAEPFVLVFLSEKWLPSVVVIQGLCMARLFAPLIALNINIINAIGRSELVLKMFLLLTPLMLGVLYFSVPYGLEYVVLGQVFTTAISFLAYAYYPGKIFGYGILKQFKDMLPIIIVSSLMAISLQIIKLHSPILQLIIMITSGFSIYSLLSYLFRIDSLFEIVAPLKNAFSN